LNQRFLLEWLLQGASSGILAYSSRNNTFSLTEEYSALLLDPKHSKHSMIGYFQMGPALVNRIANMEECFETGMGLSYDGVGTEDITKGIERAHFNITHSVICDYLLGNKHISNGKLIEKLSQENLVVADVGCGTASALIEMARRFPKSVFHGFELSREAIEVANRNIALSRLKNVQVYDVTKTGMPPSAYDFVFCYDVVHDCSHPKLLLKQVKDAVKPGAPFVIVDIECYDDMAKNISHPSAAIRYGISLGACLQSGCSEPGGLGLGTMGLHPSKLFSLLKESGFSTYEMFQIPQLKGQNCYVTTRM